MNINPEEIESKSKFTYWQLAMTPLIYLVTCELMIRYVFKTGEMGFVSAMPLKNYDMIKLVLTIIAALDAALIISILLGIVTGYVTWPGSMITKGYINSKREEPIAAHAFMITILALCVSVGIYGLVLFLIKGSRIDSYPFLIAAQLLTLMFVPTPVYKAKLSALRKTS